MRAYRRVEIRAFRRTVSIAPPSDQGVIEEGIELFDAEGQALVDIDSPAGREIIAETVRLLQKCLDNEMRESEVSSS